VTENGRKCRQCRLISRMRITGRWSRLPAGHSNAPTPGPAAARPPGRPYPRGRADAPSPSGHDSKPGGLTTSLLGPDRFWPVSATTIAAGHWAGQHSGMVRGHGRRMLVGGTTTMAAATLLVLPASAGATASPGGALPTWPASPGWEHYVEAPASPNLAPVRVVSVSGTPRSSATASRPHPGKPASWRR